MRDLPIFEKKTEYVKVKCTESEKRRWLTIIPPGELSREVRNYLNSRLARKRAQARFALGINSQQ